MLIQVERFARQKNALNRELRTTTNYENKVANNFQPQAEPLVERNAFRQAEAQPSTVPAFAAVQPSLPVPVLPEDPAWERLYWVAWEALWSRLRPPPAGSRLVAPFAHPGENANLEMGASSFVAQLSGYLPAEFRLADSLNNFYARQHDDGCIVRELDPNTGEDCHEAYGPNSAGPNTLAWAEWRRFRLTGDTQRVAEVFWPLLAYHRWMRLNRTWPNGLYWTTSYASGLANQPRVPNGRYHHRHWAWVDATAQAVLSASLLERMAVLLGEQEAADECAAERSALTQTFNDAMWNGEQSFYQDTAPDGRFSAAKSIGAYWALHEPRLVPTDRLTPFIQHLRDTWSFRTPTVLPSLSADSEGYNARTGNCCRGAVWPALTYMVVRGLYVAGQPSLAHKLAVSHVEAVTQVYGDTARLWENYAPEDMTPGEPAAEDLTGQSAAGIVALVLEGVLGLSMDWPLRQVRWRRDLARAEGYGVRNLALGREGTLDLFTAGKRVSIRTDVPFTLVLAAGQDVVQTAVPSGSFEIELD